MQTRTRNLNSLTRVIAASALVALVAGQALAAKPDAAPATTRPGARPRISFPKPTPKPDAGSEYDKPDLWAKTVVTTFANFNEPNAKLVLNAEIMNVGTQDFQGSRVIWLVATPKGGNPVVLAKKTITSLKKGKLYTFGVDQPKWMKADTALSLSIDPGDFNPGNDTWDPSKEPPVKQPG
jgi:hypothetical protein